MSKKKQLNREVFKRCFADYKYDSDYDPNNEYLIDSAVDRCNIYGTNYPKNDKNDYSKPAREYKDKDCPQ